MSNQTMTLQRKRRVYVLVQMIFGVTTALLMSTWSFGQTTSTDKTRVVGGVKLPDDFKSTPLNTVSSRIILLQEYVPSPVPTPKDFQSWDQVKRAKWFSQWEKTEEGIKFRETEEKRFSKLRKYETKSSGDKFDFEFKDVVPGSYDLAGELSLTDSEGRFYIGEFVAKVEVSQRVEMVKLPRIDLLVIRLLKRGEVMPELNPNGKNILTTKLRAEKKTLLIFWSMSRGLDKTVMSKIKRFQKSNELRIVSVGVDDRVAKNNRESFANFADIHESVDKADSAVFKEWGVQRLPSFWLIDQAGKIQATHSEIAGAGFDLEAALATPNKNGN